MRTEYYPGQNGIHPSDHDLHRSLVQRPGVEKNGDKSSGKFAQQLIGLYPFLRKSQHINRGRLVFIEVAF